MRCTGRGLGDDGVGVGGAPVTARDTEVRVPRAKATAARAPQLSAVARARARRAAVIATLVVLLVAVALLSAGIGQFSLSPAEIAASFARRLGLAPTAPTDAYADGALWNVRFPRIVLGLVVGAALGVAGALMQGVFANPLAEPAVVGVSAGAAVGACAAIVFGLSALGAATVPTSSHRTSGAASSELVVSNPSSPHTLSSPADGPGPFVGADVGDGLGGDTSVAISTKIPSATMTATTIAAVTKPRRWNGLLERGSSVVMPDSALRLRQ
ncbi:MAG: iron chelate uptake ABC transporter family permease subunit [Actinobacteria bacterium]|nr:iron chelate uptake ABC transporter family permease subunit [Actinomycetota bacterium]